MLAAARCVNCGRDVRGLPDTRKEGKLHYCSQSCYLQHESRLARGLAAPPRPNRASFRPGGVRSPLRVAWKAVKVLVILVVLAVTAFVIAVVVAVTKAAKDADNAAPAPITRAQFRHVKEGMSPRQVRHLLGNPTSTIPRGHQRCWRYGKPSSFGDSYSVCFRHGAVVEWSSTVVE